MRQVKLLIISLCLFVYLTLPSFADSFSLTIFKAERDCKPEQFGLFHQCVVPNTTLDADHASDTQNTFIKSLNFKNSISTFFSCRSTRTIPAGFTINGQTVDILMQPVTSPRISTVLIPYSGGTYTFFVKIDSPAREVFPGCEFSVLYNITTPELGPIKSYTNFILESIESKNNEVKEIDKASTLPAKWIVLIKLSGNLEAKKKDQENELEDLKAELITLQSKSDLSDFEATRLRSLPGLIQMTEFKIKDFEFLIPQIEAALPASSKCIVDNPADRTFCLDKVTEIKESLNAAFDENINTVKEVLSFLDAEFLRLKDTEKGIGDEVKKLACQIGATIGTDVPDCPPAI